MRPTTSLRVAGLVMAAGGSTRLGRPKQLLPYRTSTLLDSTIGMARRCGFDQLVVTLGGSAAAVRSVVDLSATDIVEVSDFGSGCGASISAAVDSLSRGTDGLVVLLGDQPGIEPTAVQRLVAAGAADTVGSCRYLDRAGHPLWFGAATFGELRALHGDKAVWKVLESGRFPAFDVAVDTVTPSDVDTWADYQRILADAADEARTP